MIRALTLAAALALGTPAFGQTPDPYCAAGSGNSQFSYQCGCNVCTDNGHGSGTSTLMGCLPAAPITSQPRYTVDEIDRMRVDVFELIVPMGTIYDEAEMYARVEQYLRTYMQNGTTVEDLDAKAAATRDAQMQMMKGASVAEWLGKHSPAPKVVRRHK